MKTTTKIRRESDISKWDVETDVLVVGLGCAGASAALEAVASGAEVVVVERALPRALPSGKVRHLHQRQRG